MECSRIPVVAAAGGAEAERLLTGRTRERNQRIAHVALA
jgi:hypothetical protein